MVHPLVTQLRFTRRELVRCLQGVPAEDAIRRLPPMNCLSWIVGHLAAQEHFLWIELAQGITIAADLYKLVGYGQPASTPPLEDMWQAWHQITAKADEYLNRITADMVSIKLAPGHEYMHEDIGTALLRNIYHYWFHTGEAHAIRQMLGHPKLPEFVGDMRDVRHG